MAYSSSPYGTLYFSHRSDAAALHVLAGGDTKITSSHVVMYALTPHEMPTMSLAKPILLSTCSSFFRRSILFVARLHNKKTQPFTYPVGATPCSYRIPSCNNHDTSHYGYRAAPSLSHAASTRRSLLGAKLQLAVSCVSCSLCAYVALLI